MDILRRIVISIAALFATLVSIGVVMVIAAIGTSGNVSATFLVTFIYVVGLFWYMDEIFSAIEGWIKRRKGIDQ